jgi:hypothetical protein
VVPPQVPAALQVEPSAQGVPGAQAVGLPPSVAVGAQWLAVQVPPAGQGIVALHSTGLHAPWSQGPWGHWASEVQAAVVPPQVPAALQVEPSAQRVPGAQVGVGLPPSAGPVPAWQTWAMHCWPAAQSMSLAQPLFALPPSQLWPAGQLPGSVPEQRPFTQAVPAGQFASLAQTPGFGVAPPSVAVPVEPPPGFDIERQLQVGPVPQVGPPPEPPPAGSPVFVLPP